MSDLWFSILNLKNAKHLKELNEELMLVVWHPKRWWNFCMSEDEKKETEIIFTEKCASVVYNLEVLKHFATENYAWKLDIVQKPLWISSHFGTENYTWRPDIVQKFSCLIFWDILSQNIY